MRMIARWGDIMFLFIMLWINQAHSCQTLRPFALSKSALAPPAVDPSRPPGSRSFSSISFEAMSLWIGLVCPAYPTYTHRYTPPQPPQDLIASINSLSNLSFLSHVCHVVYSYSPVQIYPARPICEGRSVIILPFLTAAGYCSRSLTFKDRMSQIGFPLKIMRCWYITFVFLFFWTFSGTFCSIQQR